MHHHIALRQVSPGKRVRVHGISAANGLLGRLCALGITPGALLDVCSQGHACCVRVRDSSVVLSGQMADLIFCDPLEDSPVGCCDDHSVAEEHTHGHAHGCRHQRECGKHRFW